MKGRILIIVISLLFVLSIIALFIFKFFTPNSATAEIYSEGELIKTIDLSAINEPYEIPVINGECENTILVEKGGISVKEANCPDELCVNMGTIKNGMYPIVCLPNKVVVRIVENNTGVDAVAGAR